jgi:hypothetical protein
VISDKVIPKGYRVFVIVNRDQADRLERQQSEILYMERRKSPICGRIYVK